MFLCLLSTSVCSVSVSALLKLLWRKQKLRKVPEEEGVRKRIRAKTERQEVGDKDPNKTRTETGEGGQSLREKGRERSGIKTFWIKPRVPFL